ncbi:MAG: radical SAM protein [Bacteroidales bacterium]|nr:radical SAM protein [Bacteroidales bacterium]
MYHLNPFIHIFKRKGKIALYNALTLSTLYLKKADYDSISFSNPAKELLDNEFVVGPDFDSLNYLSEHKPKELTDELSVAYFLLTSGCNLRCRYCFVETRMNNHKTSVMSEETAEAGLRMLQMNIPKDATLVFYGGEPFLNFSVMQYIVRRCRELELDAHFVVVTNGLLITPEIASYLADNKFEVGISLDGEKGINDSMRVDYENQGSFDEIEKAITILMDKGIVPSISCTLSKHNWENPGNIINLIKKYQLPGFGYNLPAINGNIRFSKEERAILIKHLIEAETEVVKHRLIEDKVVDRRLKSFVEHHSWLKDCAAYGQQFVITPKGKVGVCHGLWPDETNGESKTYYSVDVTYDKPLREHPDWKEWFNRTPYNMPECWSCPSIALCGGGCAKNSLLTKSNIWNKDEDICQLMEQLLPWTIWTYYDLTKNAY